VRQQRELQGKSREEGPVRSDQLRNFGPETSSGAVAKYLSGGRDIVPQERNVRAATLIEENNTSTFNTTHLAGLVFIL
jgi:hypothetical protein